MSNRTISTDVIDEASLLLNNARAIADLLSECNQDQLCEGTLSGIAYMLMEMLKEAKDLITGDKEPQS